MIPSVTKPIRQRPVPTEEVQPWVNMELLPLLRQLRQYANYVERVKASFSTNASATFETVWSSADLAVGTAVRIDANIVGVSANDRATFTKTGLFYNTGTVLQSGPTIAVLTINSPGWSAQFLIVANHVELQVNDAGTDPTDWVAIIDATESP